MNDSNLNNEFLKSLSSLNNSNEKFFDIQLPNKKLLKIMLHSSGFEWVLRYKFKIIKRALIFKNALKSNVSDEAFCFICYFYEFIMPDILMLHNILPKKISKILDIGGGIGLFELFLNNYYGSQINIDLIEVDKLLKLDHHRKNIKPKVLNRPLYVLNLAKKFLLKNNISNVNFINSKNIFSKIDSHYDIVFSFRAWGFLFELDEYLEYVNNNLSRNGIVIADINKRTMCKNKFENTFNNVKIIEKYQAHYRLVGTKK